MAYWEISREIVEFEQRGKARAGYGERLLQQLSGDLTGKFGKGFSAENLRLIRKFYITFGKSKTLSWKFEKEQKSRTSSGKSREEPKYKIALPSEQELRLKLKSIPLSSSNN